MPNILSSYTRIFDEYYSIRNRMAFEYIIKARGLPDDVVRRMMKVKGGDVTDLETLTTDQVLKAICKQGLSEKQQATLPSSVLMYVIRRLNQRGIPYPKVLHTLLRSHARAVDLASHISSNNIPFVTVQALHALRRHFNLQTLVLDNNLYLTDNMLVHLKDLITLEVLSLSGCTRLTNSLFNHIKGLPNIRKLSVAKINKVSTAGLATFWNGEESRLDSLDLSCTSVDSNALRNMFNILLHFQRLSCLNLNNTQKLINLNGLENLRSLESLSLSQRSLSSADVQQISQVHHLEQLNLEEVKIDPVLITSLIEIPLLKNLNLLLDGVHSVIPNRSLRFESITMTSLCLAHSPWLTDDIFIQLSSNLHGLLELDISNTNVNSRCLSMELFNFTQLKVLGLQGILLHDEDMGFLSYLSHLEKLNISDTGLSDEFLMFGHINRCHRLILLAMCRCKITDRGLLSLTLKSLSTLWLDGCSVSLEAALSLTLMKCSRLSYLSLKNLSPISNADEDEIQLADVVDINP